MHPSPPSRGSRARAALPAKELGPAASRPARTSSIRTDIVLQEQWRQWIRKYGSDGLLKTQNVDFALPKLVETFEPEGLEMAFGTDGGMTATLRLDGTLHVAFEATFVAEDEWHAGSIARTIDTRTGRVSHDALLLQEDFQGQGISARMMRRSLDLYDELGMDEIHVRAQMLGRYVWSLFGFDFASEDESQAVYWLCRSMYERIRRIPPFPAFEDLRHPWDYAIELDVDDLDRPVTVTREEVIEALGPAADEAKTRSRLPDEMPMSMALLAYGQVRKWHGVLDLDEESAARAKLLAYLHSKNV